MDLQKDRTKIDQKALEEKIDALYKELEEIRKLGSEDSLSKGILNRKAHVRYLFTYLRKFRLFPSLETHRTWVLYFLLDGLEIMNQEGGNLESMTEFDRLELIEYLGVYWNNEGKIH